MMDIGAEIDEDSDVEYDLPENWSPSRYRHSDPVSFGSQPSRSGSSSRHRQSFSHRSSPSKVKARWLPSSGTFRHPDYPPLPNNKRPSNFSRQRRPMSPSASLSNYSNSGRFKISKSRDYEPSSSRRGSSSSDFPTSSSSGSSSSRSGNSIKQRSRPSSSSYHSHSQHRERSKDTEGPMRSRPSSTGMDDRRAMHNVQEQNRRLAIKRLLKKMQCLYPEHVKIEVLGESYTTGQDLTNPQTMRCLERYVRDIADQYEEIECLKDEAKRLKRQYGEIGTD